MKVLEGRVGFPAANELDFGVVDAGAQKGLGAASAETAARDVAGEDTQTGSESADNKTEGLSDVARLNWER